MTGHITKLASTSTISEDTLIEVAQLSNVVAISAATISAAASDNSLNDSGSGFISAGFAQGDRIQVAGFTGNTANNLFVGIIETLAAGKMTITSPEGDLLVDDAAGETVTIRKWLTRRFSLASLGFNDLADTDIYEPADGDVITWDASLGKWVDGAGGGGGGGLTNLRTTTETEAGTSRSLVQADSDKYLRFTSASPKTLTVPANATTAIAVDTQVTVRNAGTGSLTLAAGGGVTLNAPSGGTLVLAQDMVVTLKKVATDEWDVIGQTEAIT